MSLSARETRWLLLIIALYVGGWCLSAKEIRYWCHGRDTTATVVNQEEHTVGSKQRVRIVRLTYTFRDEETGADRRESLELQTLSGFNDPQFRVQYLPGVDGKSRMASDAGRYLAIGFLVANAALAGVAFWGWRLMKADTWAFRPGRRR